MEIMTTTVNRNPGRRAAVNALAVVGFLALLAAGIALAIYSASYFPKIASRLGGAAVSLTSVFNRHEDEPSLQVVTATSTLPILSPVEATSTAPASQPAAGAGTTYVTTTVSQPVQPYGDPDLAIDITDVGYLRRDGDTGSFVASRDIDNENDGAVKFTITNKGTNVTGAWRFKAELPSSPSQTFTSPRQESLQPGDSVDFVLGFEKPKEGDDREITITVDSDKDVSESNESNNEDSAAIDVTN